jgi:anaerobic magnesium-protoporphyrin IX monomethyl ester cyclase
MINELIPYEIGISVSYPLPGTVFFEKVKNELKEKTNWTDSDELALMFRNTYAPAFYKQLHRYVHKSYRKQVAIQHLKNLVIKPSSFRSLTAKKALSFLYYAPAAWFEKQKLRLLENAPV